MPVDADRGIIRRRHPTGMYIAMYKDTPGAYYDENNKPVGRRLAEQAGFNVEFDLRIQQKNNMLEQRKRELDQEFANEEARIVAALNEAAADGISIQAIATGGFAVYQDGAKITTEVLTYEQAREFVESLRDEEPESDTTGAAGEGGTGSPKAGIAGTGANAAESESGGTNDDSRDDDLI